MTSEVQPPAVHALAQRLAALGWVRDLWVAGSLSTGDHVPGVSDLDLVALTDGPVDAARLETLAAPEVVPAATDDDVRRAAREELTGYWAWASRRPLLWLNPVIADLGLTSMARGRHALATGQLLTKSQAIDAADAPDWLRAQLRARRRGESVRSPRLRTGWIAWRDARRTVRKATADVASAAGR